ncbi:pimeloyl-ACP methyl ester esterase BioH [Paraglaciecola aestuariivivens]
MSIKLQVTTQGQGQPLVFLHGWGVNSGVWQPILGQLAEHFCISTIDLPGYGLNQQQLPEPYDLASVAHLVAQHIPENSIVVGWSLGGLVAQKIAIEYPNKLAQLILVCSSPKFSKEGDWPGIEPKVLAFFMQQLQSDFKKTLERFLAIQAMGSPHAKQDIKIIKQAVQSHPEPNLNALAAGLDMLKNVDLSKQLGQLALPVHVFLGRLDTLVPASLATNLNTIAPNVQVEVLDRTAHAPFITNPQDFVERILQITL